MRMNHFDNAEILANDVVAIEVLTPSLANVIP